MTERWIRYFEEKSKGLSLLKYTFEQWSYLQPAFHHLFTIVPPPARILDIGCGLGFTGIILEACGYSVTGIDQSEDIIRKAKNNAEYFHSSCIFETGDAFVLEKFHERFEATLSFGVVEHFDRGVTIDLLRKQSSCSPIVLASIPTKYSGDPITDERLYTLGQFAALYKEAGLRPLKRFTLGDPTDSNILRGILPPVAYRVFKNAFTYAPGIGIIGKRKE